MDFSHIPAKIQPKNVKQHFGWGEARASFPSWLRLCKEQNFKSMKIKTGTQQGV